MAGNVQLQKAFLETEKKEKIECMFNPAKFSFSMSNRWSAEPVPGSNTPSMRYAGGESGKFSLSLVFDTTKSGTSVTTHTNKLLKLMEVDTSLADYDAQRNSGRPPWVTFHWGTDLHTFKAIITNLDVALTYFSNEGLPLRANVDASFEQYEPDANWVRQNPTSGTPTPHRTHVVSPGETLDRISAHYYGDSTRWRAIAGANGISDPLAVTPGTVLAIPERRDT
jgi:contractile injection system tube protein/LysM domain-containing protein